MLRIDILTIFPEMFEGVFSHSILKRAIEKEKASVYFHNIRDYTTDKHHRVDDYPYGGGAGLVMTIQPITDCIDKLRAERSYDDIIFMTPDGGVFNQNTANHLSTFTNIIILCGHYKGIDNRIREHYITREISVGDYVLTGGELAAAIVCDAVIRLIPGVLNDETSALTDSFQNNLLSAPVYSRPSEYKGMKVPDILLSGNERAIDEWRHQQSMAKTQARRPDLLAD